MDEKGKIEEGLVTSFIDKNIYSDKAYRTAFITNDNSKGIKVLSELETELDACDEFIMSVAFITDAGVAPLLQVLKELEERNIKGKILTSDYLIFSEPKALIKLSKLKNIELKMFYTKNQKEGFHTKAYIFKKGFLYKIILGSSNLTRNALTVNKEWNTKMIGLADGQFTNDIMNEFHSVWEQAEPIKRVIEEYTQRYLKKKKEKIKSKTEIRLSSKVVANSMQKDFVNNLEKYIKAGKKRALLISATGTGKTIASALAIKENNPHKVLFLVHREQILDQAMCDYERVIGSSKSFGKLSGKSKEYNTEYLFSTMYMMAKDEVLEKFKKDEFDFIVIDEVHRAGAASYQKIMKYFEPKFWLGMTGSPDRPDGFDIYKLFDNNIVCEIRLQQAMKEDLLCPFHYFGITDIEVNGRVFNDSEDLKNFDNLVGDARVEHIIKNAKYYGYSGERVKGLVFCKNIKEAHELSLKFNQRGYNTVDLNGDDSPKEREAVIERLVNDNAVDRLDYIFTVDVFNEGIDIPEVNQIIMLRPTESPIIFIQQLGRGLRKSENKEYVIVLDFIANYTNNYMIAIALSGDRSRNKDNLRRYIAEGTRIIPGSSTIHFDKITKERIYNSINTSMKNRVTDIKYEYDCLRRKLGRIPRYEDYENYNTIGMECIFNNKSLGSYHNFLKKYEPEYEYKDSLNSLEEEMLMFVSQNLADGKRLDELLLLKRLLVYKKYMLATYKSELESEKGIVTTKRSIYNIFKVLTNNFVPSELQKKKYSRSVFLESIKTEIKPSSGFQRAMDKPVFYLLLKELLDYGILRHERYYKEKYKDTDFVLYKKYTKSDVCRLLNLEKNQNPQNIGGYFYDKDTHTLPVFITYKKDENIVDSQNYKDRFISPTELISISKPGRNYNSPEMNYFYEANTSIYLFMQKKSNDKGASEYYFLGQLYNTGRKSMIERKEVGDTVLEFTYKLDVAVREDLYQYFCHESFESKSNN